MELVALLFYGSIVWVVWLVARFFGWLFNGPRHRRRQMSKRLDYYRREQERILMRDLRRNRRW